MMQRKNVSQLGANTLIAKIDNARTYRNIPVQPEDRFLLGMSWNGEVYIDATLPFRLRSAPKIFTAVGDALDLVLKAQGITWLLKYIDDITNNLDNHPSVQHARSSPRKRESRGSVHPSTWAYKVGVNYSAY